jgi:hypothetical protein
MEPVRSYFFLLFTWILGLLLIVGNGTALAQVQITRVEVNQALGTQKDNHKYYVAGKNTVVRTFLKEAATIEPSRTVVKVFRNGQPAFEISPKTTTQPVAAVDFLCENMQACGDWAAGTYTFQAYVNGTGGEVIDSFPFVVGAPLRILAVAVKANYGSGGIKSVAGDKWKEMGKFLQKVYPLAEGNLKWTIRPTELDASPASFNLEKSDWSGCNKLSDALNRLIPAQCETNPQSAGCYDFVVGFINETILMDNKEGLAGFAILGSRTVVAVAGDDDAPGTIAHEIAHQFGIGDTYDSANLSSIRCSVNPAPDGFKGRDWDNGMQTITSCTAQRPASTLEGANGFKVNGAQVPESVHPYEVRGRGALPEMADFMSAGGAWQNQLWITPDNYDWLYRRLVIQDPTLKVLRIRSVSGPSQRFLRFSGYLSKTGQIELNPWKSFADTVVISDTTGPLMMQAVNGADVVVASSAFTVQFFMVHPPRTLDVAPFSGVIRFPADTSKFQIVKNGQVLAEVPVSANEPTVSNVSPAGATMLNGPYTITWNGSDPDGGDLTYSVEYNPDVTNPASAWMVLAEDLETRSWQEDFSLLPGGSHAKIRVTVDDGVLTAAAESAEFIVPLKKPEIFIDDLPWGNTYPMGSDVLFTAEAFDLQDEWLADGQLKWTSNLSGTLGYGSELIVRNLIPGTHVITVTGTNSAGLTASDTVTVRIGNSGGGGSACFIATAAFGSGFDPYVNLLRDFRDTVLMTHGAGRAFVGWYYRVSPPIAAFIAGSNALRASVRIMLLPAVGFSALALSIGFFWSAVLSLALLALAGMIIDRMIRSTRRRNERIKI